MGIEVENGVEEWLVEMLAFKAGVPESEIIAESELLHISPLSLETARNRLGVEIFHKPGLFEVKSWKLVDDSIYDSLLVQQRKRIS